MSSPFLSSRASTIVWASSSAFRYHLLKGLSVRGAMGSERRRKQIRIYGAMRIQVALVDLHRVYPCTTMEVNCRGFERMTNFLLIDPGQALPHAPESKVRVKCTRFRVMAESYTFSFHRRCQSSQRGWGSDLKHNYARSPDVWKGAEPTDVHFERGVQS